MSTGNHSAVFLNNEGLYIISIQKHSLANTDKLFKILNRWSEKIYGCGQVYNKWDPSGDSETGFGLSSKSSVRASVALGTGLRKCL